MSPRLLTPPQDAAAAAITLRLIFRLLLDAIAAITLLSTLRDMLFSAYAEAITLLMASC